MKSSKTENETYATLLLLAATVVVHRGRVDAAGRDRLPVPGEGECKGKKTVKVSGKFLGFLRSRIEILYAHCQMWKFIDSLETHLEELDEVEFA